MSKTTQGVLLIAFGKRGYAYAAVNLALSIKMHSPKVPVTLIADREALKHIENKYERMTWMFDQVKELPLEAFKRGGKYDPAKIKTQIWDHLPYDHTLYLDVDAVCLKDIRPMLAKLKDLRGYYFTDVLGRGKYGDKINYAIWAKQADIWNFFNLSKSAVYPAIQSSWCYIKKTKSAEKFFAKLRENYEKNFPLNKLTMQWGGTLPDELLFSVTCAQLKLDPSASIRPIFFGNKLTKVTLDGITANHEFLSIYGNGRGQTLTKLPYLEMYDRYMHKVCRAFKIGYRYKTRFIRQDKHANNR